MKQLLLTLLLAGAVVNTYAKFEASGMEPFWDIQLTQLKGNQYQANFSYDGHKVKTILRKSKHNGYNLYSGKYKSPVPYWRKDNNRSFTVKTIKKSCIAEGSGNTWSHMVTVNGFRGCGGKLLIDLDEQEYQAHVNKSKARWLNTKGFRLYKKGQYYRALPLFYQSMQADTRYALSYYNYACTASLIAGGADIQHYSDDVSELVDLEKIISALETSVSIDPKRKEKSKTDPDLALIRHSSLYYRDVLGYDNYNNAEFKKILTHSVWEQMFGFYTHHGKPVRLFFYD